MELSDVFIKKKGPVFFFLLYSSCIISNITTNLGLVIIIINVEENLRVYLF